MESVVNGLLSQIFPNMSAAKIAEVANALLATGVEEENDLIWIKESDISDVLSVVQARKLVNFFNIKYGTPADRQTAVELLQGDSSSLHSSGSRSPSQLSDVGSLVSVAQSPAAGMSLTGNRVLSYDNWVDSFSIPWSKCSQSLVDSLNNGERPSASDIRELVNHTMSDVFGYTRRASGNNLRQIACKIVQRNPAAFADYINGHIVSDGVNSLMLMLEARKENLNRRNQSNRVTTDPDTVNTSPVIAQPKKSLRMANYGCVSWSPNMPLYVTEEDMENKRLKLCDLFALQQVDLSEVDCLMDETYSYQRMFINQTVPVSEVLFKWPFLGNHHLLLKHCRRLTGIDIEPVLRAAVKRNYGLIIKYMTISAANVMMHFMPSEMETLTAELSQELLILIIMAYFHEDQQQLVTFCSVSYFCISDTLVCILSI